ncbi:PP2C family protein-serine/threonine phosphatase [Sphaerisporangium krabiense]|uniref:Serine phosphatase RsbU (Regulator of sigma subunit) n=1 Tax=Sphaerisporangium krabiense TaxID=763782 RepID=A0A7W9DRE5_9ACTN|nr:PP2C family protein-serine/threonine phosphatase [Sphaerisporangium krabiense]MBB5628014.1 serine phosphatase RsbU (regulator of sigma subunit) [Sphaerisporangium krabiense]
MGECSGTERMLTALLDASHLAGFEQVPSLVAEHAARAGLRDVVIFLADLQQEILRPVVVTGAAASGPTAAELSELKIDATLAGRAFQEVRFLRTGGEAGPICWWVPLLDGTERLGVLRVTTDTADPACKEAMRALSALVAMEIVCTRWYSDSYARLVRTRPMNVAAEMCWNIMPPLTFANGELMIAGALEPAYQIGGDAFDYSIAGDTAHLAIFDAMGHDVRAGMTANLALAVCRNRRREGDGLAATSVAAERTLIDEFGRETRFVTAILADLDTVTGRLTWINRGHHPPVLIRGGRHPGLLCCPPSHPLGLDLGVPVTMCEEQLEPGDRVLLYTDGITEARSRHGQEFGLDRFVDFIIRHSADGLPINETLRRLVRGVLEYHEGRLQDDATVLVAEWRGAARQVLGEFGDAAGTSTATSGAL